MMKWALSIVKAHTQYSEAKNSSRSRIFIEEEGYFKAELIQSFIVK